ncbi:enterotoxin [Microbacter margulisiae]|uniref:Enterotoxin n=1 Tax=Microbacter margulisiae TaxID=1350067 RepID=A0A7W5DU28_9PORP|nr:enterotoxin [Microbacter margulisiae]MBB3188715.1 hypothetical protein [Microbacter margulisiae]
MKQLLLMLGMLILSMSIGRGEVVYPGVAIGDSHVYVHKGGILAENQILKARWAIQDGVLQAEDFENKSTGDAMHWGTTPWFSLQLGSGEKLTSNDFRILSAPQVIPLRGEKKAIKASHEQGGYSVNSVLYCKRLGLKLRWELEFRNHSNYLREHFTFEPADSLMVSRLILLEMPGGGGLHPDGEVAGSPWVKGDLFFGFEYPLSHNSEEGGECVSYLVKTESLRAQMPESYSVAWGVSPRGQLRRAFLYYIERERAVPYREYLHFNSWFESYGDKLNEQECMHWIKVYGDSLIEKRHTPMQAFLFDDGWDNNQTLWKFNGGFPEGFTRMDSLARKYHSTIGVWMSPFGGYGEDKAQRMRYGLAQHPPFEVNANGFSLAGPVYFNRFHEVMSSFVKRYGISIFKIDGVGQGDNAIGKDLFYESDIEALLRLVTMIRKEDPTIYFSLTTGTWASPYWLYYGDAIWRSGGDTGFSGTGSKRQQWITYRDGEAYRNIVLKGSLYPLNSLMYHGICIGGKGEPATFGMNAQDIRDDVWDFFSSGTSLQELYIDPNILTTPDWDLLAHAIQWARRNAGTLVDVHWIGGDPETGAVYGRAAWSPEEGIISLRNPTGEEQRYHVDVARDLDIPAGYPVEYTFHTPRITTAGKPEVYAKVTSFDVTLRPYEVKILEGISVKNSRTRK